LISKRDHSGFLIIHPVLPYFLRTTPNNRPDIRARIREAFRRYYDELCPEITELRDSKDARKKHLGQYVTRLELETLRTALELSLESGNSIYSAYEVISYYLQDNHASEQRLGFSKEIPDKIRSYDPSDEETFKKDILYVLTDCGLYSIGKYHILSITFFSPELSSS
jgi:hypothetical protein